MPVAQIHTGDDDVGQRCGRREHEGGVDRGHGIAERCGVERARLRHCRYFASQPWPFPGALMLGFIAQAEPDAPRVGAELEDARWFTVDEIRAAQARDAHAGGIVPDGSVDDGGPLLAAPISIARWLIEQWLAAVEVTSAEGLPAR